MHIERQTGLSRRGFLQAATAATITAPIWLGSHAQEVLAKGPAAHASSTGYFESAFGIDGAGLSGIISHALKNGGDYCDLFFQHSLGNWLIMEDGKVNRAYTAVSLGMGARVIRGEDVGYAFTQVLDRESMLETASRAASLAMAGNIKPGSKGQEIAPLALKPGLNLYPVKVPWAQVETKKRMDLLRRVGLRMADAKQSVIKTLLQFSDSSTRVMVATSDGVLREDLRPRVGIYASCVAEKDGRKESNYADQSLRTAIDYFTPERLDSLADRAVKRTMRLFDAGHAPAGEMPVVLAAGSAGILLHEAIGHGMEADFNRRGISTYADSLGKKIAGPEVTVVDDGTIPASHGAINFDDEGMDSARTVLVKKGVLNSFLHDRQSAAYYKTASTGNGRRQSFEYQPMPRMRATFMEPGPHEPEEILSSVKKGIYANQFTNGQVNIGAGDFSFYVKSGWLIENGKLTRPIKDLNLIGNGPKVLGRVTMVANDLRLARGGFMCGKQGQTVPVSQGMPTALVSSLNVGGRS